MSALLKLWFHFKPQRLGLVIFRALFGDSNCRSKLVCETGIRALTKFGTRLTTREHGVQLAIHVCLVNYMLCISYTASYCNYIDCFTELDSRPDTELDSHAAPKRPHSTSLRRAAASVRDRSLPRSSPCLSSRSSTRCLQCCRFVSTSALRCSALPGCRSGARSSEKRVSVASGSLCANAAHRTCREWTPWSWGIRS